MKNTVRIEVEVLESEVDSMRKLIKALSDSRFRNFILGYKEECKFTLTQFFRCLPTDENFETHQSKSLGNALNSQGWGEAIVPHVLNYIKTQKIIIKNEDYYTNFLPFIAQYRVMKDFYGNNFTNSFVKTIYNFNSFVAPDTTGYKLQKLTGYICKFFQVIDDEIPERELIYKMKNILKTKSSVDIYQDQLSKQPLEIIDSTDPFGYNAFLQKIV